MSSEKNNLNEELLDKETESMVESEAENQEVAQESASVEKENEKDAATEKIEKLQTEKSELQDKYLRLYSEFENYRRRTAKEKLDLISQANSDLLVELLSILDDFERGLQSIATSEDKESLVKGVELIFSKFTNLLNKKGLQAMDALNQPFDVDYHEALTKIPAPQEDMKGKVLDVIEKGYLLKEKVLRHAKVVVAE